MRHQSASYAALPTSSGQSTTVYCSQPTNSTVLDPRKAWQHCSPGSWIGLLTSLYSAFGSWLSEPSTQVINGVPDPAQSLSQAVENLGNWALRSVMLNTSCFPVTMWPTPAASRSQSPTTLAAAAAGALHSTSSKDRNTAGGAGRDVPKCSGHHDTGKQLSGTKWIGTSSRGSSSQLADQQQISATEPANSSSSSTSDNGTAALQSQVESLHHEITCLRTSVGVLYVTCLQLKQENDRLRSVDDCSEEMLSDALQQLLGEKSALQQEVSRLTRHNQALQELLDYAAPAAAPAVINIEPWGCYHTPDSSGCSNVYKVQQATAITGQQLEEPPQQECCHWLAISATGSVGRHSPSVGSNSGSVGEDTIRHERVRENSAAAATAEVVLDCSPRCSSGICCTDEEICVQVVGDVSQGPSAQKQQNSSGAMRQQTGDTNAAMAAGLLELADN